MSHRPPLESSDTITVKTGPAPHFWEAVTDDSLGSPYSNFPRLNENQLAERWGVSVRTLQAARVKGGGVPFIRIGRSVRYRMKDVLAYEQAHLRTNTSEAQQSRHQPRLTMLIRASGCKALGRNRSMSTVVSNA